jgi:hypothetical protein
VVVWDATAGSLGEAMVQEQNLKAPGEKFYYSSIIFVLCSKTK